MKIKYSNTDLIILLISIFLLWKLMGPDREKFFKQPFVANTGALIILGLFSNAIGWLIYLGHQFLFKSKEVSKHMMARTDIKDKNKFIYKTANIVFIRGIFMLLIIPLISWLMFGLARKPGFLHDFLYLNLIIFLVLSIGAFLGIRKAHNWLWRKA